jgi:hypothetical protein
MFWPEGFRKYRGLSEIKVKSSSKLACSQPKLDKVKIPLAKM